MKILKAARFGPSGLPADWLDSKGKGVVEPAEGRDPVFGFEGIRVPLYCLMSGRRGACDAIARYWLAPVRAGKPLPARSEEHTSELQSLMRISYAVFCLKNNTKQHTTSQLLTLTHRTQSTLSH